MKIIKSIFTLLFIVFALLQINDPDPALWVFIYGIVAMVFLLSVFQPVSKQLIIGLMVGGASFSLLFFPGVLDLFARGEATEIAAQMKADKDYIEKTREFLGLWIAVSALFFLYWKNK